MEDPAMSSADEAALDRRRKLELWKAQKEAEKATKGQGGRDRTSNIGTKEVLSASFSKTFGTPITNKLGGSGLREKSSASVGMRQTSASSIGESAVKRVRPSSAAAQPGSRGTSAESRQASVMDSRPASAGPAAGPPARKPAQSSASSAAARASKPAPPSKPAPSASAARGAARAERQAAAASAAGSTGVRGTKAPLPSAARAARKPAPAASLSHSKSGKRVGPKEATDEADADSTKAAQNLALDGPGAEDKGADDEGAEGEGGAEQGEDLMAYLMPIADGDSAEGSGDEADEADDALACADGSKDAQQLADADAPEGPPSLDTAPAAQTAAADAAAGAGTSPQSEQGDAQMEVGVPGCSAGAEVAASAGAVTPHVRKVLASSDIFTPESGCESSPAPTAAAHETERAMGSTISPCISDLEKREKKSAAKRRKSSLLAFTLTPGAGPGEEGQLTPVSRSAALRAARTNDVPLLMRPLPDDATARTSPVVRPPVPSFNAPPPPPAAAAPPLPVVARPEAEEMRALAGKAPEEEMTMPLACTPKRVASSDKDCVEGGGGVRTPGSAVRRTGLTGTPRRLKSPFPRAPGLSGTPQRVLVAPPSGSKGARPSSARGAMDKMAEAAERIAAGAIGDEEVSFTPGGTRLWQDAGGIGREAGEADALAQMEAEETEEAGDGGRVVDFGRGRLSEASALAEGLEERVRLDDEDEDEECAGSPERSARDSTTPSRLPFTPGGRARAALSPIPQEEEEEADEAAGGSGSGSPASPGDGGCGEAQDEEGGAAYLQPPVSSSTPGKEYHVRKTCLGGTPLRMAVASAAAEECTSPKDSEGSYITRVPVRATSSQKEEHGSAVILTPVRRSARKQKQWHLDDISSVGEQLAGCGYAYQPNKNIPNLLYPDDELESSPEAPEDGSGSAAATSASEAVDAMDEDASQWDLVGKAGACRPSVTKRKALASPSPRKPRNTPSRPQKPDDQVTGQVSASSAPGSAQDEVSMKRRMLRAKLAEADSPLPPPSRILP